MMQLPQTVIIDLGNGSETLGSEFTLGADIRIASEDTQVSFNHCRYGLVPAAGGMSMLTTLVAPVFARSWVLSGNIVEADTLIQSGFLRETYNKTNRSEVIEKMLTQISKIAPIQRIQAKLGLFESLRSQFENGIIMDRKVAKASMVSEDWRNKRSEETHTEFMPAKSMSYAVKLSLIKNDESPTLEH